MPASAKAIRGPGANPSLLRRLLLVLGILIGLGAAFAAVTVPFVLLAMRDHNAQKPLLDSLGTDLEAIRDVSPMLGKGSSTIPPAVRGKAIVLRAYEKDALDKNAAPTKWDMRMEVDSLTWRLPNDTQATADDIRQRRPLTVFVLHEWDTPLGTYGKGGPVAVETFQKVWVVPWPDVAMPHLEEFHLLPPGAIRSNAISGPDENAAMTQTPSDDRGEARAWILKQLGAGK